MDLNPAHSGLFARRPSFFGGKSKSHAHHASTASAAQHLPDADTTTTTAAVRPLDPPVNPPATPPRRRQTSRHSIALSVADLGSQLRRSRSASLRTSSSAAASTSSSHKRTPSATLALADSPEKAPVPAAAVSRPALSISTFSRGKQKSADNVKAEGAHVYEKSPLSAVDRPKTPFGTAAASMPPPTRYIPTQKEIIQANQQSNRALGPAAPIVAPSSSNPGIVFQHIQELASKRISTLDYLRKACVYPCPPCSRQY